ncbi:MAG: CDP-2,3-bis-(O-geranylgeranyl)-sn-glycerol synthase [Candidatus Bathyarchaeia archaeon]|nr:CDP-2,3-bis-(O-geranylgeranyl)-sn-glycerol synthase [Candidatus Bathyarchaeota archaeon]
MELIGEILYALYYILPAYCANGSPVLFGGGKPIDLGRKFFDNRPIFGPNKTYRGFISGVLIGTLVGWVQEEIASIVRFLHGSVLTGFLLSFGALTGDLFGSFLKRRFGIKPGEMLPIIDQLDFVLFALLFALFSGNLPSTVGIISIIVFTIPIHFLTNFIAYLLRLKDKPW